MSVETFPPQAIIVILPTGDLTVPQWNPRKFMAEDPLRNLTAYLEKGGPVPRILVWKGNGQAPWAVISGQRRLEAYRRLGREGVEVEILDITLEEAQIMANTSNDGEPLYWLDRYEGWESLKRAQGWDQKTMVLKLGKSAGLINKACRLMRVLNAGSRQMIREVLRGPAVAEGEKLPKNAPPIHGVNRKHDFVQKPGEDDLDPEETVGSWVVTRELASRLTAFLTNPEGENNDGEAQDQAEATLAVMIARRFNPTQAGQLVEWVKAGNSPETFGDSGKGTKGEKSNVPPLKKGESKGELTSDVTPFPLEGKGGVRGTKTTPTPTPGPVSSTAQALLGAVLSSGNQGNRTQTHHALTNSLKSWGLNLAIRSGKGMVQFFEKIGFKNPLAPTVMVLLLFLMFVSSLPRYIEHFIDKVLNSIHQSTVPVATVQPAANGPKPEIPTSQTGPIGPAPRDDGKGSLTKFPKKSAHSSPVSRHMVSTQAPPASNENLAAWAVADSNIALGFAKTFYGVSYMDTTKPLDYFKQAVSDSYYKTFMGEYFPPGRILEMQEKKLMSSFEPRGEPKPLKLENNSGEFLVEGTVLVRNNLGRLPQVVSQRSVALRIGLEHIPGAKGVVDWVSEGEPSGNDEGAGAKKDDPLNAIGQGVKNISHAVNTVGQGAQAVDTAKKLFHF